MSEKFSFEKANKRIEEIVETLEKGDASLEDSMKLYEEGALLLSRCMSELEKSKQRIIDVNDKINELKSEQNT